MKDGNQQWNWDCTSSTSCRALLTGLPLHWRRWRCLPKKPARRCSHSPTTSSKWRDWVGQKIIPGGLHVARFLAAKTQSIDLTLLVTGVTYRYPGVVAKTVTTLDVLSGGRSMFGIGAAWYDREHLALGIPYPPLRERFEMLEETLQICRQMWSDDDGPYADSHIRFPS